MSIASGEDLSPEERRDVSELRARLADLAAAPEPSVAKAFLAENCTLWRYVLAKSQDEDPMAEAEAMFRRSTQWREDIQLAMLCEEWSFGVEPAPKSWATARARMGLSCFYGGIMTSPSASGGPVMVERLGRVDLPGLYSDDYAFDCTVKTYMVYLETAWNRVRATGNKTRGMIVIDIDGGGLSMLGYISVIKRIASSGVLMYPEINERVTIVNAGWFMSTLWAAVKPLLPKRTEGKIRIMNTGYDDVLHAEVNGGAECFPDFLNGKLGPGAHNVCPTMTVDSAYETIVADICSGAVSYPDSDEFLLAAARHARNLSVSSEVHRKRLALIESFMAGNG